MSHQMEVSPAHVMESSGVIIDGDMVGQLGSVASHEASAEIWMEREKVRVPTPVMDRLSPQF